MFKERRRAPRYGFNRYARIQAEMSGASRDCLIVDMSELGVRLHSEYPEIPGEFTLVIAGADRPRRERPSGTRPRRSGSAGTTATSTEAGRAASSAEETSTPPAAAPAEAPAVEAQSTES